MRKIFILLALLTLKSVNSQNDWSPLQNGTNGGVYDLIVFNNELYAAGQFSVVGGMVRPNIAKWNGTAWSTVGGTSAILNYPVTKMIIYNNELYILGGFTTAGTTTISGGIAKWNGSTWVSVNFPLISPVCGYGDAVVYNNELYVLTSSGMPSIYKYNGTTWTQIAQGSIGGGYRTLCVYNNELYASGNFTTTLPLPPGNNSGISKWNGTTWTDVGGLVVSPPIEVWSMEVHNNELYVGGDFNTIGGISATNIAKYNGSNWSVANTGAAFLAPVDELLSYNGNLYTGGGIWAGSGYNLVNVQTGSTFTTVSPNNCLNENCVWSLVRAICIYNNVLHVGGDFGQIGFTPPYTSLRYIARLASGVGIKEENLHNAYLLYPNPSTGQFTFEGLTETCSIEVTDLTGRVIYTAQLDESKKTINLQDKNSGVYFYKIKNKQNKMQQGKLILQ